MLWRQPIEKYPFDARTAADQSALASAYEAALLSVASPPLRASIERDVRLVMVSAMIAEGRRNGYRPDRLKTAALDAFNALQGMTNSSVTTHVDASRSSFPPRR